MKNPYAYWGDLFCGGGGSATAIADFFTDIGLDYEAYVVNHWDLAIATIKANHPNFKPFNTDIQSLDPREVVPGGRLLLLWASPECTFFSTARGGRPISDQQRISPWLVMDWLEKLDVQNVIIENVPELRQWGPVYNDCICGEGVDARKHKKGCPYHRPIPKLKGKTYLSFLQAIRSLGYHVADRVLNCADYGDATTRERLFIIARKVHRVVWPEPTHARNGSKDMFGELKPWRAAREIIDFSVKGRSVYNRKRPLSPNTMRRIVAGFWKYSGLPFVIGQQSQAAPRSVDEPIPTIAGAGAIGLAEPYIVKLYNTNTAASVDQPLPTVTAQGNHLDLCQPYLVTYNQERDGQKPRVHSVDEPLPTVTTISRLALVEPYIIDLSHASSPKAAEPYLVEAIHGNDARRAYSVDEPMKTITSVDAWGLVQPYLVQYNGTATARPIDEPLPTQTTKDRFGLVEPILVRAGKDLYMVDFLYRMLLPGELAAATGFHSNYKFQGKRDDIVKQIGNAVPRHTAYALTRAALRGVRVGERVL